MYDNFLLAHHYYIHYNFCIKLLIKQYDAIKGAICALEPDTYTLQI